MGGTLQSFTVRRRWVIGFEWRDWRKANALKRGDSRLLSSLNRSPPQPLSKMGFA